VPSRTGGRHRRLLAAAALGLWALVVLCWGLDIGGHGLAEPVSRLAIAAALAAAAAWGAARLVARWAGCSRRERAAAAVLPALLLLALTVRVVGIASEVEGRYYLDEGTYYHHATAIDDGEVLRRSFVYPHLTYYADALTLWMAARFPATVSWLASRLFHVTDPLAVSWLLLRLVVAVLSALAVVPVFAIAARLAGRGPAADGRPSGAPLAAGAIGALLLIFSALFNEGSHLNTCDVPSAFFATVCLACAARLLDEERGRDYLLAGVAAGLAVASKYPAGLAAVAIVAVWLRWRIRRRDFRLGLLWAGLAALATVLAVMPSLLAYPGEAFFGGRGIFFGARQYGRGGWLGVMPDSNSAFYLDKLAWSYGVPALVAGAAGWLTLGRARAARLLWLAPFPLLYLALIGSMNMVVKRNLYPVLPILSAFLGVGIAAGLEWLGGLARRRPAWGSARLRRRLLLAAGMAVVALLLAPAAELTARQDVGLATPSTREQAAAWIRAHLPPGSAILKESYTPDLDPRLFAVTHDRFAARIPIPDLRDVDNDYLLLASAAYARFRDPEALFKPHQKEFAARYDEIFRTFPLLREWVPDDFQNGPILRLYRVEPLPAACGPAAVRPAADAFVSDPAMRPAPERPIRFSARGQWALFKGCLPAGGLRLEVGGAVLPGGLVQVTDVDGRKIDLVALAGGGANGAADFGGAGGTVRLPRAGKYLFYAYLAPGSRVRDLSLHAAAGGAAAR
jgi:4-amino-4-deoxy-L-arabinose transferase-like glycosyltransferase